ncbi:selenocysteine-specific translation elongation factor [Hydrogenophaga sp.]|uniref:selenocysteine-specific translation elongation factor n=1 Tax=Hydrogenophaga sp. TaxID=1904254 RepID=UPI00262F09AF|nr:selenocysteine-specific translation elongation factor [Hydrogenophaga sp.]MCW5653618.1 selenocysteine-specific translation elongation factor [Hydrogenophaga sp.]
MIVGTAGHIDHGKTTLVRALTGVDTDRLPEEKQRGVSIELGYAFTDAPDGQRIGFIDVPGHERLVHTMLAGATGIDFALLLVAADDGVMPQTREHLAVLSLLGLRRGVVALTKCDRADAARLRSVADDVAALLEGTSLAGVPVLPVSAQTGEGIEALKDVLFQAARETGAHARLNESFRLAVDRAFTLDGVGTVVTGTVHAGQVRVGDELQLVPGERRARVRSLHAQNRAVATAQAGQRCAVALAGVERQEIERGQWLCLPAMAMASERVDVQLTLWQGEARPLRSGASVHVHLGSASVLGTVAVLDPPALEPGQSGRVQLVLRKPLGVWHGDRVVLRDASASRTLAGGRVLDPCAPVRYRRTPQRLAELDALSQPDARSRLAALLAVAPQGLDLRRFAAAQGQAVVDELPAGALRHSDAHADVALGAAQTEQAEARVVQVLADYHARHTEELGPDSARLRRLALPRLSEPLWRALLARLQAAARVQVRGAFVHLPEHGVRLSATEERLAQKVAAPLLAAGFEGAWVRDLARDSGEPEALMRVTLVRLSQRGELYQVVKDLYYPPATMARLAVIARTVAAGQGGAVAAAAFRDATGLGRKRAIQILEHFDRIGLLRRVGDAHWLRADSQLFLDDARAEAPL